MNQPEEFKILTSGPKKDPVEVQLISPHEHSAPAEIFESPEGFIARITAQEPGPHKVAVKVANQPVEGSPFIVEALPQQTLVFAPTQNAIDPSKVTNYKTLDSQISFKNLDLILRFLCLAHLNIGKSIWSWLSWRKSQYSM